MSEQAAIPAEILRAAGAILRAGSICDECLGRAFGKLGSGLSNAQRGRAIRTVLSMVGATGSAKPCWVCDDRFAQADAWASRAEEMVSGVEFETFLFGVRLTPKLVEMEALCQERFPTGSYEPLKHAFNRAVGKAFERRVEVGTVAFSDPDVSFVIDLNSQAITLGISSLYIYGRYRKLVRGIPQTRWPCRRCRGRGCPACEGSGKQYPESVEELIAPPFVEAAVAADARLHGAGREDIDARMLGTGRPFVLEIVEPRRRVLDLVALRGVANEAAGGKVEVSELLPATRRTVAHVKETKSEKAYEAVVEFERGVSSEEFQSALASLVGPIEQRTPVRVAHRRADLVRVRVLHEGTGQMTDAHHATIHLRTEGGLYVKELVSGDTGRTTPSLADRLGTEANVIALDVLGVLSGEFPDRNSEALDFGESLL